eukprot:TRINITY_DN1764_c0_g1_i7.p1 TRINITY_DN1764_c0_g1~~TRINITY_DN1764_c0_g1_i7.p1  ORF type:complete len:101 (-),score=22.05 TRINITY_DN1764_c0_g1_i7:302-604(-)
MVMMGQVSPTSFLALSPLSSLLSPLYPAPSQSVSPVTILLTLSTFRWYSEKFSKGQWDKEECISEWEKYRACLMILEERMAKNCRIPMCRLAGKEEATFG